MRGPYDTGRFADVPDTYFDNIDSPGGVARVVDQMLADLQANPDAWENYTLERFLDALSRVLDSTPQYYANRGEPMPDQPTWEELAQTLLGATGYE
ncbi:DUF7660 family protein [Micromonospora zamorensis]|uniref:DUF7660 family protein n=1 Tax=Micromonospora zamorensis TaxID=709883 RepID=UPI003CFB7AF0